MLGISNTTFLSTRRWLACRGTDPESAVSSTSVSERGLHLWNVAGIGHLAIRSRAATTSRDWLPARIGRDNLCVPVLGLGSRAKDLLAKFLFSRGSTGVGVTNVNARHGQGYHITDIGHRVGGPFGTLFSVRQRPDHLSDSILQLFSFLGECLAVGGGASTNFNKTSHVFVGSGIEGCDRGKNFG